MFRNCFWPKKVYFWVYFQLQKLTNDPKNGKCQKFAHFGGFDGSFLTFLRVKKVLIWSFSELFRKFWSMFLFIKDLILSEYPAWKFEQWPRKSKKNHGEILMLFATHYYGHLRSPANALHYEKYAVFWFPKGEFPRTHRVGPISLSGILSLVLLVVNFHPPYVPLILWVGGGERPGVFLGVFFWSIIFFVFFSIVFSY